MFIVLLVLLFSMSACGTEGILVKIAVKSLKNNFRYAKSHLVCDLSARLYSGPYLT